ncbi:unnamed protein product [Nippostrongylus brasiliensis]|uniref:Uncharacterized protein n=1 Tax=Nippostrongylus brasiliensis TaxID=27835 RepID=A0A0N4XIG8_NIPBR|nr:unnamed protein product [Nippostrongylus brasiliensis]
MMLFVWVSSERPVEINPLTKSLQTPSVNCREQQIASTSVGPVSATSRSPATAGQSFKQLVAGVVDEAETSEPTRTCLLNSFGTVTAPIHCLRLLLRTCTGV